MALYAVAPSPFYKATPTKGLPLIRLYFRCTEIIKWYKIEPFFCKTTFSLQKGWPFKRGTTVSFKKKKDK